MKKQKNKTSKKESNKEEASLDYSKLYSLDGEYRAQCWFDGWYMIGGGLKIPTSSCKEAKELAEKYKLQAESSQADSAE